VIALSTKRAALFVIDLQERLVPAMPEDVGARAVRNTAILIEAAGRLGLPIVVSQQYPKGLGATIAPIEAALAAAPAANVHRFDKVEFSGAATREFAALAPTLGRDQWIVTGMEAHVCVYQTARDLVARGYQAHVAVDAVASRTEANWRVALGLYDRVGAIATSTEVCVFDLLGRAGGDDFKALSKAIK
jgi:nicotinamidase-related amidase